MKKTILITGASSGIGKQAALKFQKEGWNVVATMRQPEKDTTYTQFNNVICPALDVTDQESILHSVQQAIANFGAIDVVLNNAGYGLIGAFESFSEEQIETQFKTNVFGLMSVTRAALPHMRDRRSGKIINVTSFAGRSIFPMYSVYHASKWAVEGFCESLQYELEQYGISVKVIEPGIVKTEFWGRSTDRTNESGVVDYDDYGNPILNLIDDAAGIIATKPEDVAAAIWRAANDETSRLRYVVGLDAHVTLTARRLLTDSAYKKALNNVFGKPSLSFLNSFIGRFSS